MISKCCKSIAKEIELYCKMFCVTGVIEYLQFFLQIYFFTVFQSWI